MRYETEYKPKAIIAPYENVQRVLDAKDMTLKTLAYKVGTYPAQFRNWRLGISNPTINLLIRVANALEINLTDLLDETYANEVKYNQATYKESKYGA